MVSLAYIAASAYEAARTPGKVVARAALRCLRKPYPPTRHRARIIGMAPSQAYEGIEEAFANVRSPMDMR